jgi:hypothetical protein
MSTTVTSSSARRRFGRAYQPYRHISKLPGREAESLRADYALMEGNTVRDYGDLNCVEDWCREAGVLGHQESLWPDPTPIHRALAGPIRAGGALRFERGRHRD